MIQIKPTVDIVSLANHKILDESGEAIKVGTLWRDHPVIFIFLRHFACVGCRAHAVQVWSEREKYEKNGARIVFISNGAPNFIQAFKEDLGITDAKVLTDPELVSFRAAGFRRGFLAALGPKSLVNGLTLMSKGHSNGKVEAGTGDYWQLGGVVVIQTDGRVSYHYISQSLGDYPDAEETLK
jgi:peroxiredoxin